MIFDAARLSLANLFAPETRSVFWKVLGLTLLALVGIVDPPRKEARDAIAQC